MTTEIEARLRDAENELRESQRLREYSCNLVQEHRDALLTTIESLRAEVKNLRENLRACELVADRSLNPAAHGKQDYSHNWRAVKTYARTGLKP